jgi:ribonuclease HII
MSAKHTSRPEPDERTALLFDVDASAQRALDRALAAFDARIVAGVDEAGLGPMLGPLTIGYSAFRVPRARCELWHALGGACTRDVHDDQESLVVADSKLVFTRNARGARRLERTVLAFLAQRAAPTAHPRDARELLEALDERLEDSGSPSAVLRETWACRLDHPIPSSVDGTEIDGLSARLGATLRGAGVAVLACGVRSIPPSELNTSFTSTDNKSITHWEACRPVLRRLWSAHAHEGVALVVDRHGGRMRYAHLLAGAFDGCAVRTVSETRHASTYFVVEARALDAALDAALDNGTPAREPRRMLVTFAERADGDSFAVALASCFAKYARERCMDAFNAYFGALQPGLMPTAGYLNDARRWLTDARHAIVRSGIARRDLVRDR